MYCSLNEAWPDLHPTFNKQNSLNNSYNSNNSNNSHNSHNSHNSRVEHFNEKNDVKQENNKMMNCNDYLNHVVNCNHCKEKLMLHIGKIERKPLIDMSQFDKSMRETIVVFIFGLILLLLLNIFCNK